MSYKGRGERVSQPQEGAWRQDQHKSVLQTKNFSLDAGTLKSQKWLYKAVKNDKRRHLHPLWTPQQNLENLPPYFISIPLYCLKYVINKFLFIVQEDC